MNPIIQHGDLKLNPSMCFEFFNHDFSITKNDDPQHILLNSTSSPGNFYWHPTLGALVGAHICSPTTSNNALIESVANSLYLDGFVLQETNIITGRDYLTFEVIQAQKVTDKTANLL